MARPGQETSTASQAPERPPAAAEPRPPARPGHSSPRPRGESAVGRGSRELLCDLGPSVLSDELGQRSPNSHRRVNELVRGRGISGSILDPVPTGAEGLPATETSVYV